MGTYMKRSLVHLNYSGGRFRTLRLLRLMNFMREQTPLLERDGNKTTYNIGFYASWAGHCNINYLQIPASVRADE